MEDRTDEVATAPMALNVVHIDDDGAACASGVLASPWWNVDVPYTPIGYVTQETPQLPIRP